MSRGSRGNRMQQLAALWLADCTSGLMQPLTRELIFHRGYVLPRFSLPSFHLLSLSLSLSLFLSPTQLSRFVFHRLLDSPLCSRSSHLLSSASLTVNPSHAIYHPRRKYRYLQLTPGTLGLFALALLFLRSINDVVAPPPSPPFRPDLNAAWHCQMQYDEASQDFMLIAPSMTIRSLVRDLYDSFIES